MAYVHRVQDVETEKRICTSQKFGAHHNGNGRASRANEEAERRETIGLNNTVTDTTWVGMAREVRWSRVAHTRREEKEMAKKARTE